jgi:rubredoxin-NAD+ reductase
LDGAPKAVTIIGAGLIGCEFADDCSGAGHTVSVVDPADYPLSNLLPPQTGMALRDALAANGVQWWMGTTVDCVEHSAGRLRITLSNGIAFETDVVLSAVGLVPNTRLAEKAKLSVGRGIMTNRLLQTSHPDVFAIGDCAAVEGEVFSYIEPIRRQAETIAAALDGDESPFDPKPPLVRVKTPSMPLIVCPPGESSSEAVAMAPAANDRIDILSGERLVGFVLSGAGAERGVQLYRELYG